MSLTSFVTSLFSTVYADAPAEESKVEEPEDEETPKVEAEAEETPEASEEVAEEEEEEPEDVSIPPMLFWDVTMDANRGGPFSCTRRFERNARTVLYALLIRSTICIVKRRLITARVSREKIVLKSCKSLPMHNTKLAAEVLVLQM